MSTIDLSKVSPETKALLRDLWERTKPDSKVVAREAAEKARQATAAAKASEEAALARVRPVKTYAHFAGLTAERKNEVYTVAESRRRPKGFVQESHEYGPNKAQQGAIARKALGPEAYKALLEESREFARSDAERSGNPGVRVGAPSVSVTELRHNGDTWAYQLLVSCGWKDKYNPDRDTWIGVRVDRDGAEFFRWSGTGS